MPSVKFVSELVPKKNQILVTNSRIPLSAELVSQLTTYPYIEVISSPDAFSEASDITALGAIIHVAGFDTTSLASTLDHTATLHKLLQMAKSYQAKFILVLPNSRNHLYQTAVSLTAQFAKNFPLTYQILEIDSKVPVEDSAADILKHVLYHHQRKVKSSPAPAPHPTLPAAAPAKPFQLPRLPRMPKLPSFKTPPIHVPNVSRRTQISSTIVIATAVVSPWVLTAVLLGIQLLSFKCVSNHLTAPGLNRAVTCARIGAVSAQVVPALATIAVGSRPVAQSLNVPLDEVSQVSLSTFQTLNLLLTTRSEGSQFIRQTIQGESTAKTATLFMQHLTSLSENLAQLQTDLRGWYESASKPPAQVSDVAQSLSLAKQLVSQVLSVAENYTTFFPIERELTYAIVLQDATELRPTGGFLDTVIMVSIGEGKLGTIEVVSSQSLDSQLKGEVESPSDFKAITGESRWYLRDSNWDADGPTSAQHISWFLQKQLGRPVDVVILANTHTVADLLTALGPVKVDNQDVTGKDFTAAYLKYLPTHTQSNSFLGQVTESLITKIKAGNIDTITTTANTVLAALAARELYIYPVTLPALSFESAGWSGGVGLPGCRSQLNCVIDYLGVFDTNISANKVDAYVSKLAQVDITLTVDGLNRSYQYTYQNRSTQAVWPAGDYKNYLRLYVPQSAEVTEVKLNGESAPKSQYAITTQNGLRQIAILTQLAPKSTGTVEVRTHQPLTVNGKFRYQFDFINQPGQSSGPLKLNLNFPPTWYGTLYKYAGSLTPVFATSGLFRYNADISRGFTIDLDLAPTATP